MTGQRVQIYWNLHKRCFSVQCLKTRRVVAHVSQAYLTDANFVVRKAGRERVLREGCKNVHAFVRGTWAGFEAPSVALHRVVYNPYKSAAFHIGNTDQIVTRAEKVWLDTHESACVFVPASLP